LHGRWHWHHFWHWSRQLYHSYLERWSRRWHRQNSLQSSHPKRNSSLLLFPARFSHGPDYLWLSSVTHLTPYEAVLCPNEQKNLSYESVDLAAVRCFVVRKRAVLVQSSKMTALLLVVTILLISVVDGKRALFAQAKVWTAALTIASSTTFGVISSPSAHAEEAVLTPSTAIATTKSAAETPPLNPKLSVNDLLKVDIEPKLDVLKDVQFILQLYPSYLEKADYDSMRRGLREGPAQVQ
jgi:hypothetical protein